ncbi:MAG TPA: hypothetical protein VL361_05550 [Candidatus Limnocylindrales bacterium]|jgi:hypothetical protein|nr:hypothetical protein [Candidatus Limnocylindrales bacterium]
MEGVDAPIIRSASTVFDEGYFSCPPFALALGRAGNGGILLPPSLAGALVNFAALLMGKVPKKQARGERLLTVGPLENSVTFSHL